MLLCCVLPVKTPFLDKFCAINYDIFRHKAKYLRTLMLMILSYGWSVQKLLKYQVGIKWIMNEKLILNVMTSSGSYDHNDHLLWWLMFFLLLYPLSVAWSVLLLCHMGWKINDLNPSDLPCLFSCKMIKQNQLENHLVLLCHFCEAHFLLVKHTVTWISWNWHSYCFWFHCEDTESKK